MRKRGQIDHHRPIDYAEVAVRLPADAAFDIDSDQARRVVKASGACPACGGSMSTEFSYGIGGTGTKGWRSRGPVPAVPSITAATVYCECGHAHPGRSADAIDVGCGRFWQIDLAPGLT